MIVTTSFMMLPSVKADDWNEETVVTLNASLAIPGHILQPGHYVFKLADDESDRNIVQIFNEDRSHLIATIQTVPAYRTEPTGETVITFEEQPRGSEGIGKWFFAGEQNGVEFVYRGQNDSGSPTPTAQPLQLS
jgi:hypothetical protein